MRCSFASLKDRSLAVRCICLAAAVVAVYALVAPVAVLCSGVAGLWTAAAAAGFCLAGAAVALVAGHLLRGPNHALQALLAGAVARMGIPLALGLACQLRGGALAEAGILYYLLVFYPITLFVETALSLPQSQRTPRDSDVGSAVC